MRDQKDGVILQVIPQLRGHGFICGLPQADRSVIQGIGKYQYLNLGVFSVFMRTVAYIRAAVGLKVEP